MGKKDLEDVQFIAEEFVRFAKMDFREYRKHLETHPEDKMHSLDMPSGGHRPIGRAASKCFWQIAERRLASEPDASAIDVGTFQRLIRGQFVKHFVADGKPIEQKLEFRFQPQQLTCASL